MKSCSSCRASFRTRPTRGASFEQRKELLSLALAAHPDFQPLSARTGFLSKSPRNAGKPTARTSVSSFLCGRDAAERIVNWDYGRPGAFLEMLREFDLLVAARSGEYFPPQDLLASFCRLELNGAFDHVSASEVRSRIANGEPWEHLVPESARHG